MSKKELEQLAQRIRWHREKVAQLTQQKYAEQAGLKRTQVTNWESANVPISISGARSLRRTYGLSLDFIIEGDVEALATPLKTSWKSYLRENPVP